MRALREVFSKMNGTSIDNKMLECLVCPITHNMLSLSEDKKELISRNANLAFPIKDGIPILVVKEARQLD